MSLTLQNSAQAGATIQARSGTVYTVDRNGYVTVSGIDIADLEAAGFVVPATSLQLGSTFRNLVDCGDASTNPCQLGTSFNGGASAKLTFDRFCAIGGASSSWVASRVANTDLPGFTAAYQWGRSATDTHTTGLTFGQVFETQDTLRLQSTPVTLSFWNKAGANFAAGASGGTFLAQVISGTGSDDTFANAAAGSWAGSTTLGTLTVTPSTSAMAAASRLSLTAAVPSNATQLAVLYSYVPAAGTTAGSNEWLQFSGIQVDNAGQATPYEHLDVAAVYEVATRYLQVIPEPTVGIAVGPAVFSAGTIAQVHVPLPSPMRKAPTVTLSVGGYAITDSALGAHTISSGAATGSTNSAITLTVTCAATLTAGLVSMMQGRTTGSGSIQADSDYA